MGKKLEALVGDQTYSLAILVGSTTISGKNGGQGKFVEATASSIKVGFCRVHLTSAVSPYLKKPAHQTTTTSWGEWILISHLKEPRYLWAMPVASKVPSWKYPFFIGSVKPRLSIFSCVPERSKLVPPNYQEFVTSPSLFCSFLCITCLCNSSWNSPCRTNAC